MGDKLEKDEKDIFVDLDRLLVTWQEYACRSKNFSTKTGIQWAINDLSRLLRDYQTEISTAENDGSNAQNDGSI